MHPTTTGAIPIEEETSPKSFASKINAPRIAGIDAIKEYSPATCLFTPQERAPAIVEPLLEMPGKVPNPCARPMIRA